MIVDLKTTKKQLWIVVALITFISGIFEFIQPHQSRPTGRWSFLFGAIWDYFGSLGLAFYWLILSVLCIVFVFMGEKK